MESSPASKLVPKPIAVNGQDTEPQPVAEPSLLVRSRRFLLPAVCFLQLGLLLGGYVHYRQTSTEVVSPPTETSQPPAHPKIAAPLPVAPEPVSSVPEDLERGDKLIRSGRLDLALPLFRAFGSEMAVALRDPVHYRVALCLEGLGRWDEAVAVYRVLLTQSHTVRVVGAAQVGLARIAFRRGRPEEVKDLMCRMLLHAAQYAKSDSPAPSPNRDATNTPEDALPAGSQRGEPLDDAQFLLALVLVGEMGKQASGELPFEEVVEPPTITWSLERTLNWADPPADTDLQADEVGNGGRDKGPAIRLVAPAYQEIIIVQQAAAQPEESRIRASIAQVSVQELLDRLAPACGLKPQWTARAIQQVQGHETDVDVENVPFLDLAGNLAGSLPLVWKVEHGVVAWSAAEETPAEELAAFRSLRARRALRDAVVHARHELAPVAYVDLGNLEVRSGQLKAAVAWYEQLLRETQRSPLLVEANYNLGLVQHRLGDDLAARKAFYRAVDIAPGHELASLAYLAVGRTWLEEGQPAQALSPLRRALGAAAGSPAQGVSAVTLAASYLWAGNPQAANSVLFAARVQVNQLPHRRLAAFLDAFSRFQSAGERRQTRHASDLLAALVNLGEEKKGTVPVSTQVTGPFSQTYLKSLGVLLVGQAYRELGMLDQMTAIYQPALQEARGAIAEEMAYALAEAYSTLGKPDEAKRLLLSLAILAESRWAAPSKFRLAELALKGNRSKEALLWCRQLLPVQPPEKMPALLQLMGRAFEQTGDDEQAARCFRGEKPS